MRACPHPLSPAAVVREPLSCRATVQIEKLLLLLTDSGVTNAQFGVRDQCCGQQAATSCQILTLYCHLMARAPKINFLNKTKHTPDHLIHLQTLPWYLNSWTTELFSIILIVFGHRHSSNVEKFTFKLL